MGRDPLLYFLLEIDPVQKIVERALLDLDRHRADRSVGKAERAAVQTLVEDAHSRPVAEQDLHRVAPLPEEHEERSGASIPAHPIHRHPGEPVEAPA